MANKKPDAKKKKKMSICINEKLLCVLTEYLKDENIHKRSRYVESLIEKDMGKRGKDVSKEF